MAQMSLEEIELWYARNGVNAEAQKRIEIIRSSPPDERPSGSPVAVIVTFPSEKMGFSCRVFGHKLRLPALYDLEFDNDVLEFYDHPGSFTVQSCPLNGRRQTFAHKPDMFVIRLSSAGYESWMDEETLRNKAEESPHLYQFSNNHWHFLPGEEATKQLGLTYRLHSSSEINWTLVRNTEYLRDYWKDSAPPVPKAAAEAINGLVQNEPGISLERLRRTLENVATIDQILTLIAQSQIYVDLAHEILSQQSEVHVYFDEATSQAYQIARTISASPQKPSSFKIETGTKVLLGEGCAEIIFADRAEVFLRMESESSTEPEFNGNGTLIRLTLPEFNALVATGKILGVAEAEADPHREAINDILRSKPAKQLEQALFRLQELERYRNGEAINTPLRTLRRWTKAYDAAERNLGNGFVGLIPNTDMRGNRQPRYDEQMINLIQQLSKGYLEGPVNGPARKGRTYFYGTVIAKLEQLSAQSKSTMVNSTDESIGAGEKILLPSRKAVRRYSENQHSQHEWKRMREGSQAAYESEPWYEELTPTTPRHGERLHHIVHIDHTQTDLLLIDSETGNPIDKPWTTVARDAFTRSAMARVISFETPSSITLMLLARDYVRRHGRLPDIVVFDGGRDFKSIYWEVLLAFYNVTSKKRKTKKSRFGAPIESLFGALDDHFIHNVVGNTQNTKNARQMTPEVDPKNLTNKTLSWFTYALDNFLFDTYDNKPQTCLGNLTPRQARQQSIAKHGARGHIVIPYDNTFLEQTRPEIKGSTRLVQPGRGIKVDHIYYFCQAMHNPAVEKKNVEVRLEPDNAGLVYARVAGVWTECYSDYYPTFANKSRRYVEIATEELQARRRAAGHTDDVSSAQIANFINEHEGLAALEHQRIKDREFQIANDGAYPARILNPSQVESRDTRPEKPHSVETTSEDLDEHGTTRISQDTPSYGDF